MEMQIILKLQHNLTQQNHAELQITNNYTWKPDRCFDYSSRLMLHLIKALSEHDPSDFNGETAEIPGYYVLGFFYVALFFMVFNA